MELIYYKYQGSDKLTMQKYFWILVISILFSLVISPTKIFAATSLCSQYQVNIDGGNNFATTITLDTRFENNRRPVDLRGKTLQIDIAGQQAVGIVEGSSFATFKLGKILPGKYSFTLRQGTIDSSGNFQANNFENIFSCRYSQFNPWPGLIIPDEGQNPEPTPIPATTTPVATKSLTQQLQEIFDINPVKGNFPASTLGELISKSFNLVLFIAGALMFYWIIWGVFHYIFSGGDKNELGKARARITWAIVGFLILLIVFALKEFLQTLFPADVRLPGGIPNISVPK